MACIRHVAIVSKDPASTAEFYKQHFDLKELFRQPKDTGDDGVWLSDGEDTRPSEATSTPTWTVRNKADLGGSGPVADHYISAGRGDGVAELISALVVFAGHYFGGGEGGLIDCEGLASSRYDAEPGTAYLLRPDGYVAARFRHPTRPALDAALARASGLH